MIFLNQKWLPNATTTSDAKTVSEVFATLGLVGYK
jgi:hypothetical protein